MIPAFPTSRPFSQIERSAFEAHTAVLCPYSEYNFTGLWCWNLHNNIEVSSIGSNLILKFINYFTHGVHFSFIGQRDVPQTIERLLTAAKEAHASPELRCVPACFELTDEIKREYCCVWDRDNFDYVFSVEALADLSGRKYHTKRRLARRFTKLYDYTAVQLNLRDVEVQSQILELQRSWESRRTNLPVNNEVDALIRVFALHDATDIRAAGIYVNQKLAAFVIFEMRQKKWAIAYFEKADRSILGVSEYLKLHLATQLMAMGCDYISFEEDLGLAGLRQAKLSYRPIFFLKKYTISRKNVQPKFCSPASILLKTPYA